ncbi:MAG: hypothetical protein DCF25_02200 [Leptolyngbya foveolarum]|uniref:Uncharacterized protein n=1 Tax=Leptolyngbya foveolarum TaxID=47253 RepID=A0A2W4UMX1_9CYAN|nr:MAG: hypothetical protein DCF25_02200 [Leptolyngbya foveolarum]
MTSLLEALKSAQFVTNSQGQQVAVQIQPAVWNALVAWLESTSSVPTLEEIDVSQAVGNGQDAVLVQAAAKLSEPSFASVWNNPEDDVYNDL